MKTLRLGLVALITVVACRPGVTPTAVPPTRTTAIDELAQLRQDLGAYGGNIVIYRLLAEGAAVTPT